VFVVLGKELHARDGVDPHQHVVLDVVVERIFRQARPRLTVAGFNVIGGFAVFASVATF
jgi:hypothetical protein